MRSWAGIVAVVLVVSSSGGAGSFHGAPEGEESPPCAAPEFRQFRFWVGDWDLRWEGGEGTNRIETALGECVVVESFTSRGPAWGGLRGMSVSTYDRGLGKWRQTWVDNQGSYLDFTGELADGKMVLSRRASAEGRTFLQRMVWHHIEADSLDWNWERSADEGKTWQVVWQIHYVRKKT